MSEDLTREELLRLYKGDIEKDVTDNVEQRLVKRYSLAAIVAVSIVSAISGGFYVFASMLVERQVETQVASELNERAKQIDDLTIQQRDRLADIADKRALAEVTLDDATKTAAKAELKLTELEAARAELEQRIQRLNETVSDFRNSVQETKDTFDREIEQQRERSIAFRTELADATAKLQPLTETLETVSELSVQVKDLADSVAQLAGTGPESLSTDTSTLSKLAETRERVSVIATQSAETYDVAQRPKSTVFLQYSGDINRDLAKKISSSLVQQGPYVIPGEERVSSSKANEVRYFYEEDASLAQQVAEDARKALVSLGLSSIDIKTVSMTEWHKAKPPEGTVELWLFALL